MCPSVFTTNIVLAMEQDRDTVKGIFDAIRDGNEAEVRRILEELRRITDPERITQINALIEQYRVQYGIPMDMLQGNDTLTIANSGLPPAIFVGASTIVYLIYRNFHPVIDFFSDVVERAIDNIDYSRLLSNRTNFYTFTCCT
jgi:hypothetical protein